MLLPGIEPDQSSIRLVAGAVASPRPLDDGRPRCILGDQGPGVDVHAGFQCLGGKHDPSPGWQVGADRPGRRVPAFNTPKAGVDQNQVSRRADLLHCFVCFNGSLDRVEHDDREAAFVMVVEHDLCQ